VEGDSRKATLGYFAPSSGLPVPMGLLDYQLGHPCSVPLDLAAATVAHSDHDYDLVLNSNSVIPDGNGNDASSGGSKEIALQAPLPDQSHHPNEGEVEDGG
jgi:hypothetical protein